VTQVGNASADSERLHQLTSLSRAFTYAHSIDDIMRMAVDSAAKLLGAERAVLMLADDDGLLHVRASHGVAPSLAEQFQSPANESLVSRLQALLGSHLAASFIGVPLVSQGSVVGLLATVRADAKPPTEQDESLLSALADQVAAPLENARLARQLEHSALLAENLRLYEAERAARIAAEAARRDAEAARDAAVRADMSKTAFLAAMSHELRTPLNAIAGYAELLEMGLRGPVTADQMEDLHRIKASQAHLLRLITDVLDYARLGSGQTALLISDVDLDAALRATEVMITPQVRAKNLRYEYQPPPDSPIVRADPHRLQQIVLNLLTNAIKFTEAGGMVRLSCDVSSNGDADHGRTARVSVRDTGRGIPADRIEAIWQPFVQLGRKLSQPGEGVGLGLAISRDLARALGGELTVSSTVGEGSEFTLTLPVASAPRS
jgi:signal transduction histidine kinase